MKLLKTKSFTLPEVLVAIILALIIVITFSLSLITSFRNVKRIVELRTATLILQEQLSLIREFPYADIESLGDNFTSSYMSLLKEASGTIDKSYYNGHSEIIKITLGLDWTRFDGESGHKTIVTLITNKGINKK